MKENGLKGKSLMELTPFRYGQQVSPDYHLSSVSAKDGVNLSKSLELTPRPVMKNMDDECFWNVI